MCLCCSHGQLLTTQQHRKGSLLLNEEFSRKYCHLMPTAENYKNTPSGIMNEALGRTQVLL